jgi:hypothetical protein
VAADMTETERPAPRIIRVPPPQPRLRGQHYVLAMVTVLVGSWIAFYELAGEDMTFTWRPVLFINGVCWLIVSRGLLTSRRVLQIRAACLRQMPHWGDDPLAVPISKMWKRPRLAPAGFEIEEFARQLPASERAAAWVVCLGVPDVREVGALRFQPEIIAPGHRWRELLPATFWTLLLVSLGFCCLGGPVVEHVGRERATLIFVAVSILSMVAIWLGQILLWPTYVRLAPGMVQFLRYGFRRSQPRITSYPMCPGTIVVATNSIRALSTRLSFELLRAGGSDELPATHLRHRMGFIERIWQALLSTAPTPPLSDEELVG